MTKYLETNVQKTLLEAMKCRSLANLSTTEQGYAENNIKALQFVDQALIMYMVKNNDEVPL